MGAKQNRRRNDFLFYVAGVALMLLMCSCSGIVCRGNTQPEKQREIQNSGQDLIEDAWKSIEQRDFPRALADTRAVLELYPETLGAIAYFQMGLVYAHPGNPDQDFEKAVINFNNIVLDENRDHGYLCDEAFIMSHLIGELSRKKKENKAVYARLSDLKISLAAQKKINDAHKKEINDLKAQIKRLKEIDFRIEKNKRRSIYK